jgi:hypothetical protein
MFSGTGRVFLLENMDCLGTQIIEWVSRWVKKMIASSTL